MDVGQPPVHACVPHVPIHPHMPVTSSNDVPLSLHAFVGGKQSSSYNLDGSIPEQLPGRARLRRSREHFGAHVRRLPLRRAPVFQVAHHHHLVGEGSEALGEGGLLRIGEVVLFREDLAWCFESTTLRRMCAEKWKDASPEAAGPPYWNARRTIPPTWTWDQGQSGTRDQGTGTGGCLGPAGQGTKTKGTRGPGTRDTGPGKAGVPGPGDWDRGDLGT